MRRQIRVTTGVALVIIATGTAAAREQAETARLRTDWAQLLHYRDENLRLPPPASGAPRVIFLGDSITESWHLSDLGLSQLEVLNRGISGQTTPQMLVRFQQDVVTLRPAVVHILAATNDFAENTGPTTLAAIEDNFRSMAEIAHANHIRVVLGSVLPVADFPWRRGLQPSPRIIALNSWLQAYARQHKLVYVDYYSALVDSEGGMKSALSGDGVHPNPAGYAAMRSLTRQSLLKALGN
jgi:lysophospholipase L1-like esterase